MESELIAILASGVLGGIVASLLWRFLPERGIGVITEAPDDEPETPPETIQDDILVETHPQDLLAEEVSAIVPTIGHTHIWPKEPAYQDDAYNIYQCKCGDRLIRARGKH